MDEARLIALGRLTKSGKVSGYPCFVYSICGIGIGETTNVITVHDGETEDGDVIMTLVAGQYSADFRLFASPLYFHKGIYIDFTTKGAEVTLQYLELGR